MNTHFFSLIIRDNLARTQDDFSRGDTRHFAQESISCGTDADCECQISDSKDRVPGSWFRVERLKEGERRWQVVPVDGGENKVFINNEKTPLTSSREVISGDVLRVGHITIRFQRARGTMAPKRKKDVISVFAKGSLLVIFALELALVFWLPHKLQHSNLMARSVLSQQVMRNIDNLQRQSRHPPETATQSPLPQLTKRLVGQEVNSLSRYVQENEKRLTTKQWRDLNTRLTHLYTLLAYADAGHVGAELPSLKDRMAINVLLKKYHDED